MGKRKIISSEDELNIEIPESVTTNKKHKKHRHKRHKKKREENEGIQEEDKTPVKIKVKSSKEYTPKSAPPSQPEKSKETNKSPIKASDISPNIKMTSNTKKKKVKGKDSGTSSEEERWLDAIESGKLEEVDDELKKIKPKDPKLMTARQRAMFERKIDKDSTPAAEQLMSLPTGYKEKVMTAEAIQKAALKSQKRKQLADEKREKDKKKTMERLLKKQESKAVKGTSRIKTAMKHIPMITYKSTLENITISLPNDIEFPLKPIKLENIKTEKIMCFNNDCKNLKKYSCSKTGVPLCSLECYKKNLQSTTQVIKVPV